MIIFDTKADVHLVEGVDFLPQNLCHQCFCRMVIHSEYKREDFLNNELITDSVFIYHFDTMQFCMEGHLRTFMSLF